MRYIYKITSTINNKVYIGVTNNTSHRKCSHFTKLKNNKHYNALLQNHYNKYGNGDKVSIVFNFEIIEICDNIDLAFKQEKYWIKFYNSNDSHHGFNLTGGGEMNCWSKEHIAKRKETLRNKSNPIYVYTTNGLFINKFRSIIDISEQMNLNRNAVSNAFNRGIRYKNYLFYKEQKIFTEYIPASIRKQVYIEIYNINHILIDRVFGLKECAEKYNININSLNSRCRRRSIINNIYFKKSYSN